MDLYTQVILPSLYYEGYKKEDIMDYKNSDYIVTYNPLTSDNNTMSCMIFKETGIIKLLNGVIITENNEEMTTATLTTWLRKLKCKLFFYIKYVFFELDIDKNIIYDYIQYVENKLLSIPQKYNSKYEEIRKKLYVRYVLDIDMLNISTTDSFEIEALAESEKPKKIKTKTEYLDPNENEIKAIENYAEKRGLPKLSIKENVLYRTVVVNDIYRKPALCFAYEDNYYKYRIIFEKNKKYRFRSNGKYTNFFIARKNNTKKLYIVEGEIESLSILDFIDDDVFAIHNTNSLPSNLSLLDQYEEIIVKIDKDRYKENKKAFNKIDCIVDYKVEHQTKDYNDYLVEGILTKEIIEQINTKRGD